MLRFIIAIILGYIFGSVCAAVILTRKYYGSDVRDQGSGNAGTTNVARVFGIKAGLLTLLGDMGKTALSALAGWLLAGPDGLTAACTACILGHCYPVFFEFRGGKGVSVAACIALVFDVRMFLTLLVIFVLLFLLYHRVSLCSITAAAAYPWIHLLFNPGFGLRFRLCCFIGLLVIFLHRENIRRLLRGEEARFQPKSNQEKKLP